MMFAELGETLLDRNFLVGKGVGSRGSHVWPQIETCKDLWTCLSILQNQDWEMVLPQAIGRYCWGSYQDWLILVKEVDCYNLEISLLNPFSRKKTDLPKTWNFYHKMVLSALPSVKNFVCMLVHSQHRELAFWVRGAQPWLKHKVDGEPFEDAVFSEGSFYLLSSDCSISKIKVTNVLAAIRTEDDHEIKTEPLSKNVRGAGKLRCVEVSCGIFGELLLVCRFYSPDPDAVLETPDFKAYKLDFSRMAWKRVHDLGDQILFLGFN